MNTLLAKFYRDPVYGDNVNLRCDTGGVPIPAITWYKDGRLLEDSYKHSISVSIGASLPSYITTSSI